MDRQVIGYYDKSFNDRFFELSKTTPDDLVGSRLQLCFGRVKSVDGSGVGGKLELEENPDDIIEKMLNQNISTLVEYDRDNQIAKIVFDNKIPQGIFDKYYSLEHDKIYED